MDAGLVAHSIFRPYNGEGPWGPNANMFINGYWHENLKGAQRSLLKALDEWEARQCS